MARHTSKLITTLDESQLTGNHIRVISAAVLGDMLEFFDLALISFVIAFIAVPWGLTYTASASILLAAGFGSIIGAIMFGNIADRVGRRPIFMFTIIFSGVMTGLMFFTPEGNWIYLVVLRFFVGLALGGLYCVDMPLVQEFAPANYRGRVGGIVTAFIPIGTLLASTSAAYLRPFIGWRGLFLVGLIPALLALLIRVWVPESPRWLIRNKKYDEAAAAVDWVTKEHHDFRDVREVGEEWIDDLPAQPQVKFSELFKYPRSVIISWGTNICQQTGYSLFTMWGPALLAMVIGRTPAEAAKLFIVVTLGGFIGRWFWSFMSDHIGRRVSGMILGVGAAVMLLFAIFNTGNYIGGVSVFWLCMIGIYFFADGGYALVGPYSSEVWPSNLRATGMGSAYGMGGIGKLVGPVIVALFAGSSNLVSPKATIEAITPVYLFLAVLFLIQAILFFFALETKGKSMEEIDAELEAARMAKA
ncbi:General substrate transporter [Syntrophomonas zehnderi OL-4]|uniref:General substrate transporter n=1 Tax=Syntrophomonas zehnderi OL-4 TaxID=690567 RepID=A0A0E4GBY3_9FIRM|nr:MFS transporter [Syntrophomonas zehnderi]CFY02858.1 General substrate transporter [Syntrophomonas zehnderi OL-4]